MRNAAVADAQPMRAVHGLFPRIACVAYWYRSPGNLRDEKRRGRGRAAHARGAVGVSLYPPSLRERSSATAMRNGGLPQSLRSWTSTAHPESQDRKAGFAGRSAPLTPSKRPAGVAGAQPMRGGGMACPPELLAGRPGTSPQRICVVRNAGVAGAQPMRWEPKGCPSTPQSWCGAAYRDSDTKRRIVVHSVKEKRG